MANTSVIWLGIGMIIGGLMAIILGAKIIEHGLKEIMREVDRIEGTI